MQTMIYCGECNHRGDGNIGVAVNTGLMGNSVVIVNAGLFVNTGVSEKNRGMIVNTGVIGNTCWVTILTSVVRITEITENTVVVVNS